MAIPYGNGMWPANGEIDVLEMNGGDNVTWGTLHWDDSGHQSDGSLWGLASPLSHGVAVKLILEEVDQLPVLFPRSRYQQKAGADIVHCL